MSETHSTLDADASLARSTARSLEIEAAVEKDPSRFRILTGDRPTGNLHIGHYFGSLQNRVTLADKGVEVWLRFVLVPGLTDDPENVEKVAEYAATLPNVSRVEVLPFHQMGKDKWDSLGLDYQLGDAMPPSNDEVEAVRARFRKRGLTVY